MISERIIFVSQGITVQEIHALLSSHNIALIFESRRLKLVGQAERMCRQGLRNRDWEIPGLRVHGIPACRWENSL